MISTDARIAVGFDRAEYPFPRYLPGETITGFVDVTTGQDVNCKHLYIRMAWHTEGRGDKDRQMLSEMDVFQGTLYANSPQRFLFTFFAPREPWSYAGKLINIVWAVEVDVDVPWKINPRHEQAFILAPEWA